MTVRQAQGHPERSRGVTIDEELQKALDVDPSPEFLARVRTQIASEPAPPQWRFSWMFAAAAGVAAVVVAVAVVARPFQGRDSTAGANRTASEVLASRSVGAVVGAMEFPVARPFQGRETTPQIVPATRGPVRDAERVARQQGESVADAEILIDQREAAALRRLLNIGTLHAEQGFGLTAVDEIQIEPLGETEPLVITPIETVGEGVRQ